MFGKRRLMAFTPVLFAALAAGPAAVSQESAAACVTSAGKGSATHVQPCGWGYRLGFRDGFRQGYREGRRDCGDRYQPFYRRSPDCYTRGWIRGFVGGYSRACGW
ncbi:hypothetical protein Acsp04_27550 [Actinomadura sp. NBRC 104425]|nr:hypothetical protein Acsp04_27550 [Actinomadura sp. NBRC 104425]